MYKTLVNERTAMRKLNNVVVVVVVSVVGVVACDAGGLRNRMV